MKPDVLYMDGYLMQTCARQGAVIWSGLARIMTGCELKAAVFRYANLP